jgi:DGQHR domain-containing protein
MEIDMSGTAFSPPDGPFKKPDRIPVTQGPRLTKSGTPIVAGFISAGTLAPDNYVVPSFDPRTGKGYQRPPQANRVNELANDLLKGRVDLPTAILLNVRGRDVQSALRDGFLDLNALAGNGKYKFHVVDGQHRIKALDKLIQEENRELWSKFEIPFVCMLGADDREELEQFYIVNTKAKPVRTDLAYELLSRRHKTDPTVADALAEKSQDWIVKAQSLTRRLGESSPPWRGRIRFAAAEKADTILPSASMVTSLKPLLTSSYFGMLSLDQQVQVLDAFWRGLRDCMAEPFDEPAAFALQKGVGVIVWHAALVSILELVRSEGLSVLEPDSYQTVLNEPLRRLQGDDSNGVPVTGVDFWRVAPRGAAGSYSSSAGRRVLIAKIVSSLPRVKVR